MLPFTCKQPFLNGIHFTNYEEVPQEGKNSTMSFTLENTHTCVHLRAHTHTHTHTHRTKLLWSEHAALGCMYLSKLTETEAQQMALFQFSINWLTQGHGLCS